MTHSIFKHNNAHYKNKTFLPHYFSYHLAFIYLDFILTLIFCVKCQTNVCHKTHDRHDKKTNLDYVKMLCQTLLKASL